MLPFAYQHLETDWGEVLDNKVFPTLRAAFEYFLQHAGGALWVWYPGGVSKEISFHTDFYRNRVHLDMTALRLEAQRYVREQTEIRDRRLKEQPSSWYPTFSEDEVLKGFVQQRQFTWKAPSDIPWDGIEKGLER